MYNYHNILKLILSDGTDWLGNRTEIKTSKIHNIQFDHNMDTGYPLLTTKKINPHTYLVELEGFIGGITSKLWYQEHGCFIWDEWCNPELLKNYDFSDLAKLGMFLVDESKQGKYIITKKIQKSVDALYELINLHLNNGVVVEELREPIRKLIQLKEDDLGPIYGAQWRSMNGTDQFDDMLTKLKTNPLDRRIIVNAWNPSELHKMALPPCHWAFEIHSDGKTFDLKWIQRSVDTFLGLPFNIGFYAMLMLLIEKETGLKPGKLSGSLGDVHIYENHQTQVQTQLSRTPKPLPKMHVTVPNGKEFNIYDWTADDYTIEGYDPDPFIKAPVAV